MRLLRGCATCADRPRTGCAGRSASPTFTTVLAIALSLAACANRPPEATQGLSLAARLRLAEAMDRASGGGAATLMVLQAEAARAPNDPAAWERLGAHLDGLGQLPESADALRRALALKGPTPRLLIALGRVELRQGNAEAALQVFSEARRLDAASAEAEGGLALALDLLGRHEEAQAAYLRALRLAPGHWTHRSNLAMSYLMSGDPVRAAEAVAEAERNPAAPRPARHNLALALAALGEQQRVVRLLSTEMGHAEATAMAEQMRAFATWLLATATRRAVSSERGPGAAETVGGTGVVPAAVGPSATAPPPGEVAPIPSLRDRPETMRPVRPTEGPPLAEAEGALTPTGLRLTSPSGPSDEPPSVPGGSVSPFQRLFSALTSLVTTGAKAAGAEARGTQLPP